MSADKIMRLAEILQAEHPTWSLDLRAVDVWEQAIGSLPWPTLEAAARRYLATDAGRPTLSRLVKFLPPGAAAKARGEPQESVGSDRARTREETFDLILRECTFDGASLWNAYENQTSRADRFLAWRKLGSDGLRPPDHWNQQHHSPGMLLAFLDRFVGVGGPQGPSVSVEALPF